MLKSQHSVIYKWPSIATRTHARAHTHFDVTINQPEAIKADGKHIFQCNDFSKHTIHTLSMHSITIAVVRGQTSLKHLNGTE